ncbi:hypothetical protein D9M72_458280 [compost metagenome]
MRETTGDHHRPAVLGAQHLAMPLKIGRRVRPHIDGDIEDFARETGDKFRLVMRRALEMHAANRACHPRKRMIDLGNRAAGAKIGEFLTAEET